MPTDFETLLKAVDLNEDGKISRKEEYEVFRIRHMLRDPGDNNILTQDEFTLNKENALKDEDFSQEAKNYITNYTMKSNIESVLIDVDNQKHEAYLISNMKRRVKINPDEDLTPYYRDKLGDIAPPATPTSIPHVKPISTQR